MALHAPICCECAAAQLASEILNAVVSAWMCFQHTAGNKGLTTHRTCIWLLSYNQKHTMAFKTFLTTYLISKKKTQMPTKKTKNITTFHLRNMIIIWNYFSQHQGKLFNKFKSDYTSEMATGHSKWPRTYVTHWTLDPCRPWPYSYIYIDLFKAVKPRQN